MEVIRWELFQLPVADSVPKEPPFPPPTCSYERWTCPLLLSSQPNSSAFLLGQVPFYLFRNHILLQGSSFVIQQASSLSYLNVIEPFTGFSRWLSGEDSARQHRRCLRLRFNPWVRKIPWRRKWHAVQCSCLGNPMDKGAWWATVHESQRLRHDWTAEHIWVFLNL